MNREETSRTAVHGYIRHTYVHTLHLCYHPSSYEETFSRGLNYSCTHYLLGPFTYSKSSLRKTHFLRERLWTAPSGRRHLTDKKEIHFHTHITATIGKESTEKNGKNKFIREKKTENIRVALSFALFRRRAVVAVVVPNIVRAIHFSFLSRYYDVRCFRVGHDCTSTRQTSGCALLLLSSLLLFNRSKREI